MSLISGSMLGNVSDESVTVWFRPATAENLKIKVTGDDGIQWFDAKGEQAGEPVRVELNGLRAQSKYAYQIMNQADAILGNGNFRTPPKARTNESLRIAFGSCFHKIGLHNPNLMKHVKERGNLAMLLLGDLAVDDRETKLNRHQADYLLRDVSKPWRAFAADIPVYASWDDHDYLNNDKSGLQNDQISNEQRNAMRKLWQENWVNPPTSVVDRGIYFNTVIGDVEIIMLDTRSCRNWSIRGERGAYLGDEQMSWLLETLKNSKAKFKILTSGTMWNDKMSKAKNTWGTWDTEAKDEILGFIEENKIGGVILLSGDRHGARGFIVKCPSGFPLYEFEAATLGGVPGPPAFYWEKSKKNGTDRGGQIFGYKGGLKAFGELSFDPADAKVTFRLIGESGEVIEEQVLNYAQLTP